MINKELKRLNRRELVDIIYQMKKNEEQMKEQIATLESQLQDKKINISVAGSIAEATVDLTKIFTTAQVTADLYLHQISTMKEDTEKECAKMIEDAKNKVEEILTEGKRQYEELVGKDKDRDKWQQLFDEIKELGEPKTEEKTENE